MKSEAFSSQSLKDLLVRLYARGETHALQNRAWESSCQESLKIDESGIIRKTSSIIRLKRKCHGLIGDNP